MAIFRIAMDKNGHFKRYINDYDLKWLIQFQMSDSLVWYSYNILPTPEKADYLQYVAFSDHILSLQRYAAVDHYTRAYHYIITINNYDLKRDYNKLTHIASRISQMIFKRYQSIISIHLNSNNNFEIHIVVNPVDFISGKIRKVTPENHRDLAWRINMFLMNEYNIELKDVDDFTNDRILSRMYRNIDPNMQVHCVENKKIVKH